MSHVTQELQDSWYNTLQPATFTERRDDGLLFTFGEGQQALVQPDEYRVDPLPEPGDEVVLLVERTRGDAVWLASARKAQQLQLIERLERMARDGEVVEGIFLRETRGGIYVDIGLRAFCPASQIDAHHVDRPGRYTGQLGRFKVIEFKADGAEVIVSRRAVVEGEREAVAADLRASLEAGQVYTGTVRTLRDFGAFVDIGGIDGLLHVSELGWGHYDRPHDVLSVGDTVQVSVLAYDAERDRLSLTRKPLLEDPWELAAERFHAGEVVGGTVVSVRDFGAFVEIATGVQGLVHASELSWTDRVRDARDVLKAGQEIVVKLLNMDAEQRRMELSLKKVSQDPWEEVSARVHVGDVISGPVREVTRFGAFVEVLPGVDGLIHVSNISWTETIDDPASVFTAGQEVSARVISIDLDERRIGLGVKQLTANPWEDAARTAKVGQKVDVTITRITGFGAFAQIAEGVEGLIHISELSDDRVERVEQVVRIGQTVSALVLSLDPGSQRASLSLKRDALEDEGLRSYTDEGATTVLGELLRERLGLSEEE